MPTATIFETAIFSTIIPILTKSLIKPGVIIVYTVFIPIVITSNNRRSMNTWLGANSKDGLYIQYRVFRHSNNANIPSR